MKYSKIVKTAAACILLIAGSACASGKKESDPLTVRAGEYQMTGMSVLGSESGDAELLNESGLKCMLVLKEDGSGVLNLFTEESELTWNAETISYEDRQFPYEYKEDTITVFRDDSSLVFTRSEPEKK